MMMRHYAAAAQSRPRRNSPANTIPIALKGARPQHTDIIAEPRPKDGLMRYDGYAKRNAIMQGFASLTLG